MIFFYSISGTLQIPLKVYLTKMKLNSNHNCYLLLLENCLSLFDDNGKSTKTNNHRFFT